MSLPGALRRSDAAAAVVGWCALLSGATLRLRIPPDGTVQAVLFVALAQLVTMNAVTFLPQGLALS